MKVIIEISEAKNGKFSDISLTFNDLNDYEQKVNLSLLNFVDAYDLTNDTKSIKFDLFLVSALVYGIDNLLDREYYSDDGWSREIEVVFPVYNMFNWKGQEGVLEDVLKFLTGDYWTINFELNGVQNCFIETNGRWNKNRRKFNDSRIKLTSLFSGGLDSLIGVIDQIESLDTDEEILLVSHFDFYSSGPNRDQNLLFDELVNKYPEKIKNNWIQTKLGLSRTNMNGEKIRIESNYRSRSFLFIGLGCFLSPSSTLIVPENGTISINYPLTPSRVSSLSTRTTHPFVLNKLQLLLNNIGINVTIVNPYRFLTKGEMVKNCLNTSFLNSIMSLSTSCGKSGHNRTWINKNTNHCGVCMPCVYRRAALNVSDLDRQVYGRDITQPVSKNSFVDLPALINFFKKDINLEQMKRDILVNGSIPLEDLEMYAEMVLRSKKEVLELFKEKGNYFMKSELKINNDN